MYYNLTIQYPLNEITFIKINDKDALEYINGYLTMMNTNYIVKKSTFHNIISRQHVAPRLLKFFLDNNKIKIKKYIQE